MGLCLPKEEKEALKRSIEIDTQLRKSTGVTVVKVLMLGTGESGKSTFVKQMKIIKMKGYTTDELVSHRADIFRNVLDNAKQVVKAMEILNAEVSSPGLKIHIEYIKAMNDLTYMDKFPARLAEAVDYLWSHGGLKNILDSLSRVTYLLESTSYFFDSIQRIADPEYVPTELDVIKSRVKTTGISEIKFLIDSRTEVHIFDVGGQRSERKKWIHCFEGVTSVIFMVAISEYNQVLIEDSRQNRLVESLVLFKSIVNSKWFIRSSIILLLNKIDIFKLKIKTVPLKDYLPEYDGANEYDPASKFIKKQFLKLNTGKLRIYAHYTCCTDTDQVKFTYKAIEVTLVTNSLTEAGL